MGVNESAKYQLAKTFTELAIQNNLIDKHATATETAKEVTNFFNTIVKTINKPTEE
ncbi:hypothetical protein LIQ05_09015 [Blautia glucerasea]|uniref:hypothetical protein n=1 Tax=Blautia glucerasea TaxID=536633 RepID=UPI001D016D4C|nr:hypothetical protein [Blautia glucerasea]MCB5387131.1 hypothetical protein [Blautia glucerasea]MCB5421309.1 hypothetical protein [Blautia luti]